MLLLSCMHVEKSYSFLLLCDPCQEITQDCTRLLLPNHLNYLFKSLTKKKKKNSFCLLYFGIIGHCGSVTCVCLTSDGKQVITASTDGTVRCWKVESTEIVLKIR